MFTLMERGSMYCIGWVNEIQTAPYQPSVVVVNQIASIISQNEYFRPLPLSSRNEERMTTVFVILLFILFVSCMVGSEDAAIIIAPFLFISAILVIFLEI
jgi:hypothetical protein